MNFIDDPDFVRAVVHATADRLAKAPEFQAKVAQAVADRTAVNPAYMTAVSSRAGDTMARNLQHALEKDIKEAARKEVANIIGLQLGAKVAKLANQLAAKLTLQED